MLIFIFFCSMCKTVFLREFIFDSKYVLAFISALFFTLFFPDFDVS